MFVSALKPPGQTITTVPLEWADQLGKVSIASDTFAIRKTSLLLGLGFRCSSGPTLPFTSPGGTPTFELSFSAKFGYPHRGRKYFGFNMPRMFTFVPVKERKKI